MSITRRFSLVALLGLAAGQACAITINVPANFPTIQDAVNAASSGDTILVAPGTYSEQIDLLGKSLVVQSTGNATNTTITSEVAPVVRVTNVSNATLRGFTITGVFGTTGSGGAILSDNSTLAVDACTLSGNVILDGVGAAIFVNGGSLALTASTIANNAASFVDATISGVGAGVSINNATANISATTFASNGATNMGGAGLGATGTSVVTITGGTFENNVATVPTGITLGGGGAISVRDTASLTINGGNYTNNLSDRGSGGAIRVGASTGMTPNLTISGATFTNNTANGSVAGGVAFGGTGTCSITLCTFEGNRATASSGGAFSTLSTASATGGGVQIDECTFRNNRAAVAGAVQIGSLVVISDSLFEANEATGATSGSFVITGGAGAIRASTAPIGTRIERSTFRNNIVRFAASDGGGAIRASRGFLAINACTFEDNRVEVNPNNNFTIHGGAVHLEGRTSQTLPVFSVTNSIFRRNTTRNTTLGVGGKGGAIFTTLRQQVTITGNTFVDNTSQDGGHVMVETTPALVTLSDNTFTGGGAIPATGGNVPGQGGDFGAVSIVTTNASATPTVVDNTTVTGVTAKNNAIIHIISLTQPVTIEDSSFLNTQAIPLSSSNGGDIGALFIASLDSQLRRTTFSGTRAKTYGAVRLQGTAATVEDCTFIDTQAVPVTGSSTGGETGALSMESTTNILRRTTFTGTRGKLAGAVRMTGTNGTIEDCTFTDCRAVPITGSSGDGGGAFVSSTTATLRRVTFNACTGRLGGGLNLTGGPGDAILEDVDFIDCIADGSSGTSGDNGGGARVLRTGNVFADRLLFDGNVADRGGAIWTDSVNAIITNSVFAGSQSRQGDGAVAIDGNGAARLVNSTIANNTGGAVYVATAGNDELANNIIWGNTGSPIIEVISILGNPSVVPASYNIVQGGYVGGTNLSFDPLFVDPVNGNFALLATSPAIDAGDNTKLGAAFTLDLASSNRYIDVAAAPDTGVGPAPIVDMGAFEAHVPNIVCDDIDFNNNGVFPEDQDVVDFFDVLAGGIPATCDPIQGCNDIDFNNNEVFPEDQDVIDFFNVLAGGNCP